jgi:hypothetical protein
MKRQTPVGVPGHQFYNNIIYIIIFLFVQLLQFFHLHTTMAIINDIYFVFLSSSVPYIFNFANIFILRNKEGGVLCRENFSCLKNQYHYNEAYLIRYLSTRICIVERIRIYYFLALSFFFVMNFFLLAKNSYFVI